MKRFWWVCWAVMVVFVSGIGTVAAQDEVVQVETDAGSYEVTLPPGWTIDENSAVGEIITFSADSQIMISIADVASLMGEESNEFFGDEDFQAAFFETSAGEQTAGLDFEFRDDRVAGFRFFEEGDLAALLLLLEMEPDVYMIVTATHLQNDPEELFDAVNKVISTVEAAGAEEELTQEDVTEADEEATEEPATASGGLRGGSLGGGSSSSSADTVDSCDVEADSGIALRVGPGANRATFGYLQNSGTFSATAQSEADGVWYRLDKREAAPNASAAEIWVSADDVDAEAACDDLEMVEASAPITRTTGSGGGSTSGNSGGSTGSSGGSNTNNGGGNNNPPPAGSGNPIPASGTWTLSLSSTTNASCEGTENVAFPTTDLFSQLSFTGGLSASRDGTTLIIDGDAFVLQGETTYVGSFSIPEGNMQMYLVIQSSSLITGQAVYNFNIDGRPCSATIGLSVTRG